MMKISRNPSSSPLVSAGLLLLRMFAGTALMFHGFGKLQNPFGWMGPSMPGWLQALSVLAEFGGGLALILGLLTPIACLGLLCNFGVAVFTHISHGDPFVGMKGPSFESALGYFTIALTFLLTGPGAFSLDALIFGRSKTSRESATAKKRT